MTKTEETTERALDEAKSAKASAGFYRCENKHCTLGARGVPGHFQGGPTKDQVTLVTGDPNPEFYGEGVCPNCFEPGQADKEDRTPLKGNDPLQKFHDEVAKRVADPDDPTNKDTAVDDFYAMVSADKTARKHAGLDEGEGGDE